MYAVHIHSQILTHPPLCREASVFLKKGPQRIGSTYKKAVYKQYTDATYRTEVTKPDWLGYLGPLLMAEEGDTLVVQLRNIASRPYSIHPHGLNYSKGNEGEEYMNLSMIVQGQTKVADEHICDCVFVCVCIFLLRSPVPGWNLSRAEAGRLRGS